MGGDRLARVALPVLMVALAVQSIAGMRLLSATWDEVSHLPSGYTYLETGEVRLNIQHPPLIKLLCALPLLPLAPDTDFMNPNLIKVAGYEWVFGAKFLDANDADRLLFWGRLPVVLLALLLLVYVFVWSKDLFGPAGGALSAFLLAFCPNVIAHSHLVTMDVGLSCFATMTLYHLWRSERRAGGWGHRIAAGTGLGLALATKFSALVLLPSIAVLLAWSAWHGPIPGSTKGPGFPARLAGAARTGVLLALLAAAVLYVVYLFPANPSFYLDGIAAVNRDHTAGFQHYLMGEFRARWWSYFLVAFLIKTPIPTLITLMTAVVIARRVRAGSPVDEAFLVLPAIVFTIATTALADNLGIRYLLPVFPLLFVFAGRVAPFLRRTRMRAWAAAPLAAWLVAAAVWIHPDHLAYFNELVGGPSNGWRWLDDSNIDWGQDLKRLKTWMDEHHVPQISLIYTGNASPAYYGIRHRVVPPEEFQGTPRAGVYVVSTQALIRGELWAKTRGWRTNWLSRYEPADRIGYSLYVFRFGETEGRRPWPHPATGSSPSPPF